MKCNVRCLFASKFKNCAVTVRGNYNYRRTLKIEMRMADLNQSVNDNVKSKVEVKVYIETYKKNGNDIKSMIGNWILKDTRISTFDGHLEIDF